MEKYIFRLKQLLAIVMVGGLLSSNSAQAMAAFKQALTKVPAAIGVFGREMGTKAAPSAAAKGRAVAQETISTLTQGCTNRAAAQETASQMTQGCTSRTVANAPAVSVKQGLKTSAPKVPKELPTKIEAPKTNVSPTVNELNGISLQPQGKISAAAAESSRVTRGSIIKTVDQTPQTNSSITVSAPQTVPARRGRPPKASVAKELPAKTVEQSTNTNSSTAVSAPQTIPAKRGRPPKASKVTQELPAKTVEQSTKSNISSTVNAQNGNASQLPKSSSVSDAFDVTGGTTNESFNQSPITDSSTAGSEANASSSQPQINTQVDAPDLSTAVTQTDAILPQPQNNAPNTTSATTTLPREIINQNQTTTTSGTLADAIAPQSQNNVPAAVPNNTNVPAEPITTSSVATQTNASAPQPQNNTPAVAPNTTRVPAEPIANRVSQRPVSNSLNQTNANTPQPSVSAPVPDTSNVTGEIVNQNAVPNVSEISPEASAGNDSIFTKGYRYAVDQISSHKVLTAVVIGALAIGAAYYYYKYYVNRPVLKKDSLLKQQEAVTKFAKDLEEVVSNARKELLSGQKGLPMRSAQKLFGSVEINASIAKDSACALALKLQKDTMFTAYEKTQQEIRKWHAVNRTTKSPSCEWYNSLYDGKDNKNSVAQSLVKELSRIKQELKALEDAHTPSA